MTMLDDAPADVSAAASPPAFIPDAAATPRAASPAFIPDTQVQNGPPSPAAATRLPVAPRAATAAPAVAPTPAPSDPAPVVAPPFIPDAHVNVAPVDPIKGLEDYVLTHDSEDVDPEMRARRTQPTMPDLRARGYTIPEVDYHLRESDPQAYARNLYRTAKAYDECGAGRAGGSSNGSRWRWSGHW